MSRISSNKVPAPGRRPRNLQTEIAAEAIRAFAELQIKLLVWTDSKTLALPSLLAKPYSLTLVLPTIPQAQIFGDGEIALTIAKVTQWY